jgi:hypothetical protein
MTRITLTHEQATEIFKAINGIGGLLKLLPCKPEDARLKYAIMSNLALIQVALNGSQRVNSN